MRKLKIAYNIHIEQNSTNAIRVDLGDITISMTEGSRIMDSIIEPYIKDTLIKIFDSISTEFQSNEDLSVSCDIEDLSDETFYEEYFELFAEPEDICKMRRKGKE